MANLSVKTVSSIHQNDAKLWNQLSAAKPFQSFERYVFGEQVMSDHQPFYLLARDGDTLISRASLWLMRNEPMPKMLGRLRKSAAAYDVKQSWAFHWKIMVALFSRPSIHICKRR
jgi:hypothetical protein